METTSLNQSFYLLTPARSLEAYLDELQSQFDRLPLTSPARGAVASRIRAVEAEIDARSPP